MKKELLFIGLFIVLILGSASYVGVVERLASLDAAGRLEVTQTTSVGDYNLARDSLPLYFDQVSNGSAIQYYDSIRNGQRMEVTTNGDYAVFQTKQRHPYFPGHPQQPEFTYINLEPESGVIKRVGYFSSSTTAPYTSNLDGIWLESSNGTVKLVISKEGVDTVMEQSTWKLSNGIDWSNFNISLVDFLYLGGSSVSLYQIFDGKKQLAFRYNHANHVPDVFIGHPSQPIRAEIRSIGGSGNLTFICANVGSQGIINEGFGMPISVSTGSTLINYPTASIEYPILSIRKNDARAELYPLNIDIASTGAASELYRWRLLLNPTLSSALSYSPLENTFVDVATGNSSITIIDEGHVIASGVGSARSSTDQIINSALRLGQELGGTYDTYVLAVTLYSNGQDFAASFSGVIY